MSREWNDNYDGSEAEARLWEQALVNAMNSKRGQAFFRELEKELLAMKARGEGRLIAGCLISDGNNKEVETVGCCTLGVLACKKLRPEDIPLVTNRIMEDPYDFPSWLPSSMNIAPCLIAEIGTINDTQGFYYPQPETDEQRFDRMLKWVQDHISNNGEKVRR